MNPSALYRKTAKGQEEIATRAHHLGLRERSLLVVVDGKSPVAELLAKVPHVANGADCLDALERNGFIEAAEVVVPAAPAAAAPAAAPAPVEDAEFREAMRFTLRFLHEALGPGADDMAAKVEACRNRKELAPVLDKCRETLAVAVGKRKAEQFWSGVTAHLPQP